MIETRRPQENPTGTLASQRAMHFLAVQAKTTRASLGSPHSRKGRGSSSPGKERAHKTTAMTSSLTVCFLRGCCTGCWRHARRRCIGKEQYGQDARKRNEPSRWRRRLRRRQNATRFPSARRPVLDKSAEDAARLQDGFACRACHLAASHCLVPIACHLADASFSRLWPTEPCARKTRSRKVPRARVIVCAPRTCILRRIPAHGPSSGSRKHRLAWPGTYKVYLYMYINVRYGTVYMYMDLS